MSRAKTKKSTLAGLIDSDGEEDQLVAGLPSPETSIENITRVKKGGRKPKAVAKSPHAPSKVTKAKPAARRLSGRVVGKAKVAAAMKGKRPALADKTNLQASSDTEGEEGHEDIEMEDAQLEESVLVTKKSTTKAGVKKPSATKKAPKVTAKSNEVAVIKPQQRAAPGKRGRPAKKDTMAESSLEKVVPETQIEDEMEVDADSEEELDETIEQMTRNASEPQQNLGRMAKADQSNPDLRRKLGDMTKKFNALTAKYEELCDVGVKQAEQNFDKFKKQSEEKSRVTTELVASLKADLAHHSSLAKDSKALKKKLESQTLEMAALQVQVADLKASLAESQAQSKTLTAENKTLTMESKTLTVEKHSLAAENKTLSARLAANRTAAASVESVNSKVPGSAVKANGGIRMIGTVEAAQLAQAAQLKEDIYSDLTGLIIQGVKREAEEDIFNCLQTGRNGTLHFKLATANDKSSESYDDAHCSYVPQLDPGRDKVLMELLPDYLVDEITFPRPDAAKFYARVVKALTEKII